MARGTWGGLTDPRIFRVTITWEAALQKCQTGFFLRDVGAPTLTPAEVVDLVVPFAETKFNVVLHTADKLTGVDVVNIETKEGASHTFPTLAGSMTGDPLPTFVAYTVSMKGELRAKYGQGRMSWPCRSDLAQTENSLNATGLTPANAAVADLMDRFVEGGLLFATARLVNVHDAKPAFGTRPALPKSWYDVSALRINSLLKSRRSRMVGQGS